ncbi:MAG: hypothetical protein Q4G66_10320 [bacterium]|nr:hypothetical protein [bacterium]
MKVFAQKGELTDRGRFHPKREKPFPPPPVVADGEALPVPLAMANRLSIQQIEALKAEYTRAMQAYMLQIDKVDNVSEATWWVNKQGKKLVDDLGGKNGECYLAIVEYAAEHTKKLQAQLKKKA